VKAVIQRVSSASVSVEGDRIARIDRGLVVLLGVEKGDSDDAAARLAEKVCNLRIFEGDSHQMDKSLLGIGGQALVVSQFTLCADCTKGRRPSFDPAAEPDVAERLYQVFCGKLAELGVGVQTGAFGRKMQLSINNDGPVTIVLEMK
jgi:D-tyrosyl-tRNA(Tyr) deacylase